MDVMDQYWYYIINTINTWCNDGYVDEHVDEYDDMWSSGGNGSSLAGIESSGVGSYCNNEYAGGLLSSRGCDKDGNHAADASLAAHSGNNGDDTLLSAGMDPI